VRLGIFPEAIEEPLAVEEVPADEEEDVAEEFRVLASVQGTPDDII